MRSWSARRAASGVAVLAQGDGGGIQRGHRQARRVGQRRAVVGGGPGSGVHDVGVDLDQEVVGRRSHHRLDEELALGAQVRGGGDLAGRVGGGIDEGGQLDQRVAGRGGAVAVVVAAARQVDARALGDLALAQRSPEVGVERDELVADRQQGLGGDQRHQRRRGVHKRHRGARGPVVVDRGGEHREPELPLREQEDLGALAPAQVDDRRLPVARAAEDPAGGPQADRAKILDLGGEGDLHRDRRLAVGVVGPRRHGQLQLLGGAHDLKARLGLEAVSDPGAELALGRVVALGAARRRGQQLERQRGVALDRERALEGIGALARGVELAPGAAEGHRLGSVGLGVERDGELVQRAAVGDHRPGRRGDGEPVGQRPDLERRRGAQASRAGVGVLHRHHALPRVAAHEQIDEQGRLALGGHRAGGPALRVPGARPQRPQAGADLELLARGRPLGDLDPQAGHGAVVGVEHGLGPGLGAPLGLVALLHEAHRQREALGRLEAGGAAEQGQQPQAAPSPDPRRGRRPHPAPGTA